MMANLSIKNLKVLYASVGIKPFIENGEVRFVYINQSKNHICPNIIMQDKKVNQRRTA